MSSCQNPCGVHGTCDSSCSEKRTSSKILSICSHGEKGLGGGSCFPKHQFTPINRSNRFAVLTEAAAEKPVRIRSARSLGAPAALVVDQEPGHWT